MCGMMGNTISPIAWPSQSDRDPLRGRPSAWLMWDDGKAAADLTNALLASARGDGKSEDKGKAVRFVCFFRIFRIASVVTNWN